MPAVCRGNSVDADVPHCSGMNRSALSPNVLVNGMNNTLTTDSQSIILGDGNISISTLNSITIGKSNKSKNESFKKI